MQIKKHFWFQNWIKRVSFLFFGNLKIVYSLFKYLKSINFFLLDVFLTLSFLSLSLSLSPLPRWPTPPIHVRSKCGGSKPVSLSTNVFASLLARRLKASSNSRWSAARRSLFKSTLTFKEKSTSSKSLLITFYKSNILPLSLVWKFAVAFIRRKWRVDGVRSKTRHSHASFAPHRVWVCVWPCFRLFTSLVFTLGQGLSMLKI